MSSVDLPIERSAPQNPACASDDCVSTSIQHLTTDKDALGTIFQLVRDRTGFDLSGYKITPLMWRIQHRLAMRGLSGFAEYVELLHKDSAEIRDLVREIPIHVTQFFRDPCAWETLSTHVVDRLFQNRRPNDPIRAWSAACASGEEAYSVAMLLAERASRSQSAVDFKVFATDASPHIVVSASLGIFPQRAMSGLTPDRQARFFRASGNAHQVCESLRQKLVFASQHLVTDPPFRDLDLVICRNLLIYLDAETTRRAICLLHSALRAGGYLFLGAGESLPVDHYGFVAVSAKQRIFRKVDPATNVNVSPPRRAHAPGATQAPIALDTAIHSEVAQGMRNWSEELRVSNEELDASREELRAVNEELYATNQQLHRSHDEVNSTHAQLQVKIDELQTQANVLSSAGIMALFLDDRLRVRWFTPAADALFPLLSRDIGRRITDLSPKFHDPHFIRDVLEVMRTQTASENQVRSAAGLWLSRRILPFRGGGDPTKGVAITFVEVGERIGPDAVT